MKETMRDKYGNTIEVGDVLVSDQNAGCKVDVIHIDNGVATIQGSILNGLSANIDQKSLTNSRWKKESQ